MPDVNAVKALFYLYKDGGDLGESEPISHIRAVRWPNSPDLRMTLDDAIKQQVIEEEGDWIVAYTNPEGLIKMDRFKVERRASPLRIVS